jgi:hypothetical protein
LHSHVGGAGAHPPQRQAAGGEVALIGHDIFPEDLLVLLAVEDGVHDGVEPFLGGDVK